MKMTDILYDLSGDPSPYGLSQYRGRVECSRRAYLNEQGDRAAFFSEFSGRLVGLLGHVFMELHYSRQLAPDADPRCVKLSKYVDERARCEAERVFLAYRAQHPDPLALGKVLSTETSVGPSPEVHEAIGLEPFTCRVDMVVAQRANTIKALKKRFEHDGAIGAWQPGAWLVDFKFLRARAANLMDTAMGSLQYNCYPTAYNAEHPKEPVLGTLQLALFKTKTPGFRTTVVPAPGPEEDQIRYAWARRTAAWLVDEPEEGICNPEACFPFNSGICHHYVSGVCKRY